MSPGAGAPRGFRRGCDQASDACSRPDCVSIWTIVKAGAVAVAAAVLMVLAFRAYLNPSALIDFANSRLC
jgi:hypothetical protein